MNNKSKLTRSLVSSEYDQMRELSNRLGDKFFDSEEFRQADIFYGRTIYLIGKKLGYIFKNAQKCTFKALSTAELSNLYRDVWEHLQSKISEMENGAMVRSEKFYEFTDENLLQEMISRGFKITIQKELL